MDHKCPICGSAVEKYPGAPTVDHDGKEYLFCSEECRGVFLSFPEAYTDEAAAEVNLVEDSGF
ncbi:MAG: YHS domain-containing protein [Acidobacteriota bacterium]